MKALVLIDLQTGFDHPKWGVRNNSRLEDGVASLISEFRGRGFPVVHVRHDSFEPESPLRRETPGFDFLPCATPIEGEVIFTKHVHGAFLGTNLESHLKARGIAVPCFAGLTADHCVSTSVRIAHDLGFAPVVVSDAVATFPRESAEGRWLSADAVQEAALASLRGEFAQILTTDELRKLL